MNEHDGTNEDRRTQGASRDASRDASRNASSELPQRVVTVTYPNGDSDFYWPPHEPVTRQSLAAISFSWKDDATKQISTLSVLYANVASIEVLQRPEDAADPDLRARIEQAAQREIKARRDAAVRSGAGAGSGEDS